MAKTLCLTSSVSAAYAPGTTRYTPITGLDSSNTTESLAQINTRGSGTYSGLRCKISSNTLSTATHTIRLRKNAANGNQVINVSAGATGTFSDASNTDVCAAGDDVCYSNVVSAGGTGTSLAKHISVLFAADTNSMCVLISNHGSTGSSHNTASVTRYYPTGGLISLGTTEANSQLKIRQSGTIKYFQINVSTNARTNNTTFRTRKNSANGTCLITVGSSATGTFEDTSNSDSVVANDLICSSVTTLTGTNAIVVFLAKMGYETTTGHTALMSNAQDSSSAAQTFYYPLVGSTLAGETTDTDLLYSTGLDFTASDLSVLVTTNALTATSTHNLWKNGSTTALTISISAGTTGFLTDTTNTESIATTDTICHQFVIGSTGTNIITQVWEVVLLSAGAVLYPVSITESSISVSDTNARVLTAIRSQSESSISVSDSNARILTALRTLAESSIAVSDANTRLKTIPRTIAESSITVSDALTRKLTALRTLAESSITVSESVARALIAIRVLTESSISVSDSLVRKLTAFRSISESSISVNDSLTRLLIALRTLSESTISVSDTLTKILTAKRTLTESSIAVSETVLGFKVAGAYSRDITESTIAVSETLARSLLSFRSISETVTVSDSLARRLTAIRSLSESTIAVSETLTRIPINVRFLTDTITVSETLTRFLLSLRSLSDSVAVSDSVTRVLVALRSLTESSIGVSETVTRRLLAIRILAESSIAVSETLSKLLISFRTISEPSISISESLTRKLIALRLLSEPSISVSESVTRQLIPIIILSETVAVSDSLARMLTAKRTLAESTITVSDILGAARLRVRLIAESAIVVSDSLIRKLTAFRVIGETVFISEVLLVVGPDYEIALYISDRGYSNPLRARIQFISRNEPYPVFYTYDSFNPDARPFNIINMSVRLAQGEIGTFSMTIEDSAGIVDKSKIGLGVKVVVEARKEFATPYFKLITGFVRRIRPLRPATGALLYQIEGYGSQVVFNERIVNFKRAAKRTAVDSTVPLSTDSQMQAHRLFSDLITATDIIPLKNPTIQSTGRFELTEVSPEVTDFIAQIAPGLTDAATVANALAEITGAIWGTDANGNPFFRYPTQKHSGILVKDAPVNTDLAANTSVNLDAFDFDDSIDVSEGFANRLYVLNAVDTKSTASSSKAQGSTTLTLRGVAQQWTATDNNVTSAAFILSRVGNPTTTSGSIFGKLRADNNGYPNGATLATFEIPISSIDTSKSTIFVNDIKTKDGVINPGSKYWWYLLGTGLTDDSNTVRWHHDNDLSTADRLSAQLPLTDADPTKPGDQLVWIRSVFGPVYAFSTFSSVRHILTQSDGESIKQYGLIEGIVDLPSFEDDATFQKALAKIIYTSAKPKRTYEYARLTIPTQRIFMPGEMITIIDSKASLTSEKSIMAEIAEVNYSFDTGGNAMGCKFVDIRLVAFLDKTLDDYMSTREC